MSQFAVLPTEDKHLILVRSIESFSLVPENSEVSKEAFLQVLKEGDADLKLYIIMKSGARHTLNLSKFAKEVLNWTSNTPQDKSAILYQFMSYYYESNRLGNMNSYVFQQMIEKDLL